MPVGFPPKRRLTYQHPGRGTWLESPVSSALKRHLNYQMVMARREVLVQLDDNLVGRLDELAKRRGSNRSELLRRGALAVLEAEDLRQADVLLQDAYRHQSQEPDLVEVASRLAATTGSEW